MYETSYKNEMKTFRSSCVLFLERKDVQNEYSQKNNRLNIGFERVSIIGEEMNSTQN